MQDICHCINQSYAKHKQDTLYKLPKVYTILGLGASVTADELGEAQKKYDTTIDVLGHDCLDHSATDDDSDNADVCIVGDEVVSLRDPVTLVRIGIPGKGIHCTHSGCFDIETFLQFHEHTIEWKCPHCFDRICGVQVRNPRCQGCFGRVCQTSRIGGKLTHLLHKGYLHFRDLPTIPPPIPRR